MKFYLKKMVPLLWRCRHKTHTLYCWCLMAKYNIWSWWRTLRSLQWNSLNQHFHKDPRYSWILSSKVLMWKNQNKVSLFEIKMLVDTLCYLLSIISPHSFLSLVSMAPIIIIIQFENENNNMTKSVTM